MAEYGVVAPNGPIRIARLAEAVGGPDERLPIAVVRLCAMLLAHIASLGEQIGLLEKELRERARHDDTAKRLMTIPGIGVVCATALEALTPAPESFAKGRDFAAWLGLTPRQKSSGGKTRLGGTIRPSKKSIKRMVERVHALTDRTRSRQEAHRRSRPYPRPAGNHHIFFYFAR